MKEYTYRLKTKEKILTVKEKSEIYTYEVLNEHDKIFKDILNDKEEARNFINKYLDLKIPIPKDKLELYNTSYVTSRYKTKEADIVYKMKDKNIFFLIEHQSTIDISMPYRIENYSMEIINTALDKEKMKDPKYKYPKVIAIVLYTGNKKWKAKLSFSDIQEKLDGYDSQDRSYTIVDINNYKKQELLDSSLFVSKVLLLESSKTEEELLENIKLARKRTPKNKLDQMDKILSVMLSKKIGPGKGREFLEDLQKGGEEMVLAVEYMIERENRKIRREGKKEGIKEGKKEGIKEGINKTIKGMLLKNMDENIIKDITGIDDNELEKIKKELLRV